MSASVATLGVPASAAAEAGVVVAMSARRRREAPGARRVTAELRPRPRRVAETVVATQASRSAAAAVAAAAEVAPDERRIMVAAAKAILADGGGMSKLSGMCGVRGARSCVVVCLSTGV